jgi:hypothetical protein
VQDDLRGVIPEIALTDIGTEALQAVRRWYGLPRQAGWEWFNVTKRRKVRCYDLAVWHGEQLCGLAFGPASTDWIGIAFVEGNPDKTHPLKGKITDIAIAVLETQAAALDIRETRLLRPLPELVERYRRRGYEGLAERAGFDYLAKIRTPP